MVSILLSSESRYPVNRKLIKQTVLDVSNQQKIKSDIEVSILIIGDRKMSELNEKYLKSSGTTDVISFPLETNHYLPLPRSPQGFEALNPYDNRNDKNQNQGFVLPPDDILRLGDIVISYPQAVKQAAENNVLVDEEIGSLVKHGLLHLLGIHHKE